MKEKNIERTIFEKHAAAVRDIMKNPQLEVIGWEATRNCNLNCIHCCLPKDSWKKERELTTDEVKRIFSEIAQDFDVSKISVAITGGEATIRKDLVEIVKFLIELKYKTVGVDSNGYLYSKDFSLIDRLVDAGMRGPTISIDGLREGYRKMRGRDNFKRVMKALEYMLTRYPEIYPTVITVVSKYNMHEIPTLFDLYEKMGVYFARVAPLVPVGRAKNCNEYQLSDSEFKDMLLWIAQKRREYEQGEFKMQIELADDGWCGRCLEGRIRGWKFWCQTGTRLAFILYDGKISACSNISRDLAVQGDARTQRFKDVWFNEFKKFRNKDWLKQGPCLTCKEWNYCLGGAMHHRDINGTLKQCHFLEINKFERKTN